jgi:hypothetical protein
LERKRAARLLLAQVAVAHDDPVRVGTLGGNVKLSAIARSRTGFDAIGRLRLRVRHA